MRILPVLALAVLALALPTPVQGQTLGSDTARTGETRSPELVGGKSLKEWIKDLKNPDPGVREAAIQAVVLFGPDSRDAVPAIVDLLNKDWDVSLRVHAALALMNMEIREGDVPSAVRALAKQASGSTQAIIRLRAAVALGHFEEDAKEAIPDLIIATQDRASWEIRRSAIASLARVGTDKKNGPHQGATNALIRATRDSSARVRREAVMALGMMGSPSNPTTKTAVLNAFRARIADSDKTVAVWSYVGLMAIDKVADPYLSQVFHILRTGDVEARLHAVRSLGVVGSEVKKQLPDKINDVVNAIISALKDQETSVSGTACWALSHLGQNYDPGIAAENALADLSKSKTADAAVKQMAATALDSIKGKKKKDAKP